jgi:hypothetical protein
MKTVSGVDKDPSDPVAWGEDCGFGGERGWGKMYTIHLLWVLSDGIPFF